jgi:hypothetical protein
LQPRGIKRLIASLERLLPEALPRRYGSYEPPQHVYVETGRDHFLSFLEENLHSTTVWYPARPVLLVTFLSPRPIDPMRRGFRAIHFRLDFEAAALDQPGWDLQLRRVWKELSIQLHPFYGDVRVLHGYRIGRGTWASGVGTEHHPVKSWWWRGIPSTPANAIVLGSSYQVLWPGFMTQAKVMGGLAFLDGPDWRNKPIQNIYYGEIPRGLVDPDNGFGVASRDQYAPIWPFDGPIK